MEPYQGKNASNAFIRYEYFFLLQEFVAFVSPHPNDCFTSPEAKDYPTTQKAVVNGIIQSKLNNDTSGYRICAMDNRYTAIPLFLDLRNNHNILAVGTIRKNRKGWDKDLMDLSKKSDRGSYLLKYDKSNGILAGQWNDSKVVAFISTLCEYDIVAVKRRIKRERLDFHVPRAL